MVGKKVRMTAFDRSDVFHTLGQIKSIKRTIFFQNREAIIVLRVLSSQLRTWSLKVSRC